MSTAHVFLTRFNLPTEGVESLIRAREGWLRERIELFDKYTVPSVRSQLTDDVHWIVYLDTQSPQWLLDRMDVWEREGLLTPILRESVSGQERADDIRRVVGRDSGAVVTSNLDNDDGLSNDFVLRLRTADVVAERQAIYLVNGLITNGSRIYAREDRVNAFCAVREDLSDLVTCWVDWHNRLNLHMPVVEVEGAPGWLQVIHGANVSNRVRGRMVEPGPFLTTFPGLLDGVQAPTMAERARDTLVEAPLRRARDSARSGVRAGLVRALGKERFDEVKYRGGRLARGTISGARRLAQRVGRG
ncbi:glycosyltransferase [Luteococcus sp. Sow4_B9]|uniref:glycosyltransferase n=1 Tax=Luteococcus sp. Sow4_B9 TaxID=3438792 RepID=UPI003F99C564